MVTCTNGGGYSTEPDKRIPRVTGKALELWHDDGGGPTVLRGAGRLPDNVVGVEFDLGPDKIYQAAVSEGYWAMIYDYGLTVKPTIRRVSITVTYETGVRKTVITKAY